MDRATDDRVDDGEDADVIWHELWGTAAESAVRQAFQQRGITG